MCGIAGIVNCDNVNNIHTPSQLLGMTNLMKHRGPDDEGFAFFNPFSFGEGFGEAITAGGNDSSKDVWQSSFQYAPQKQVGSIAMNYPVALGFRRLSILDLSAAGHQPMCSKDKNLWIVFNGEIYNYLELREELKKKGHHFETNTDTEVILVAYLEWGEKCLDRFNGMWAFVIYNRKENKLFGARDRFGVKPFYYYFDKNVFAFASEQKALVKSSFVKTGINKKMVFDYLALGEIEAAEEGFFQNILELMPAFAFSFDINNKSFKKWQYYSLNHNNNFKLFNRSKCNEYTERLKELIFDAINIRLRSDVAVGSCLSGGLDSSSIVCVANQLLKNTIGEQQKVFTASFANENIDESKWAELVVKQTQTEWHQTFPTAEGLMKDIETLIYCQDIPMWNTSTYAQFKVMQLAKENGIKVVLDGQGGDELFAGYQHHRLAYLIELLRNYMCSSFLKELNYSSPLFFLKNYFKYNGISKLPSESVAAIHKFYFNDLKFINQDIWNEHKNRFSFLNQRHIESLNQMLCNEFNHSYLKGYLKCEDRCSMWFSIESRTPFADDINLIEYVFQLPAAYKMNQGISKFLLRETMKDILPEKIRNRKDKLGYTTPNNRWLFEMKDELKSYLTKDLNEYIRADKIIKEYDHLFTINHKKVTNRIFPFLLFAIWKKVYCL